MILTGASWHLCCAHRDKAGVLHGHTWDVLVWAERQDAEKLLASLRFALSQIDHGELSEDMMLGEDIASFVLTSLPNACEVIVSRPFERLYARVVR